MKKERIKKTDAEIREIKKEKNQRRNFRERIEKAYKSQLKKDLLVKRSNPKKNKKARRRELVKANTNKE